MRPRARRDGLLIQDVAGETLVYDLERHKAHCLGTTLAWLWKRCDGRSTLGQLAERLSRRAGRAVDEGVVSVTVRRLSKAHLLEEPARDLPVPAPLRSRRELIRKAALVGGLSLVSISAPTAADAASCRSAGSTGCTSNSHCCSPAVCRSGRCCLGDGGRCSSNSQCCGGDCEGGRCDD